MHELDALMQTLLGQPRTVEALVADLARPLDEVEALVDAAFVEGLVIVVAREDDAVAPADRLVRVTKRAFARYGGDARV